MKISISGHGGVGKDEVAKWLTAHTTLKYTKSTSAYALPDIRPWLEIQAGLKYDSDEECYEDRSNHRSLWALFIDEINKQDPAFLYRRCLADQDILTGVRRKHEFQAVLDLKVIDLKIWIERPGHPVDPTQGYGPEYCDIVVINETDKWHETEDRLRNIIRILGFNRGR
jgi:hypothetical protein